MLPRAQRRLGRAAVEIVVQADVDGDEVVALQQLAEIAVNVGDAERLGRRARARLVDVRDGDDVHVTLHLRILNQVELRDLPAADNADANRVHMH